MMWNNGYSYANYGNLGALWGNMMAGLSFLLVPILVWSLFWKGWALWKAAKNDSKPWFIALLLINTMGILDILYIFVFGKVKETKVVKKSSRRK